MERRASPPAGTSETLVPPIVNNNRPI